jgi:hypothetical protein
MNLWQPLFWPRFTHACQLSSKPSHDPVFLNHSEQKSKISVGDQLNIDSDYIAILMCILLKRNWDIWKGLSAKSYMKIGFLIYD